MAGRGRGRIVQVTNRDVVSWRCYNEIRALNIGRYARTYVRAYLLPLPDLDAVGTGDDAHVDHVHEQSVLDDTADGLDGLGRGVRVLDGLVLEV